MGLTRKYPLKQASWRFYLLGGAVFSCLTVIGHVSNAQPSPDQPTISVPPPPPLVPVPVPAGNAPPQGETVFQAPGDVQRSNAGRYLVYVNGDSPYLLQQVQAIEPQAFVQQYQGRSVIQIGTFGDEANARRRIEELRNQGIEANIANNGSAYSPTANSGYGSTTKSSNGYMVIVPGHKSELPNLAQQVMKIGIRQESVQMKDAPLGPHLAIGPFADYREANDVNGSLRKGGLDSRIYFDR